MENIVIMLENIANNLEKKGLTKEAYDVDIIANTIEKLAYRAENDPAYVGISKIVNLLQNKGF
jgi:hypothetical protein